MSLYLKHRPKTLEKMIGNEATIASIKSIVERDQKDIPHAYLFTGPSGCGKTTLGRILAQLLGCQPEDYREIDSVEFGGVAHIRDLRKQMRLRPLSGPCRVWLLDECHKLSNDAQNALLTALESTPKHVYIILCTTDPQKLIKTLVNRCTPFEVKSLTEDELIKLLKRVCKREQLDIDLEVLGKIAQFALGSARHALVVLDKIKDLSPEAMSKAVLKAAEEEQKTLGLCRALLKKEKWRVVASVVKGLEDDPEAVRQAVLGYMTAVLLNGKDEPQAAVVVESFKEPFYTTGRAGLTLACYYAVSA